MTNAIDIMLIKDNNEEIHLFHEALEKASIEKVLYVANDALTALDYLLNSSLSEDRSFLPALIILDLDLPTTSGLQLLKTLKESPNLKSIPVLVMSSSTQEQDILRGYKLHANSYIIRPSNQERWLEIVKSIQTFWFETTSLPFGGSE